MSHSERAMDGDTEKLVRPACLGLLDCGWSCGQLNKGRCNWMAYPPTAVLPAAAVTGPHVLPVRPPRCWEFHTRCPVTCGSCRGDRGRM